MSRLLTGLLSGMLALIALVQSAQAQTGAEPDPLPLAEMAALQKKAGEQFNAGAYANALATAERLSRIAEQYESARGKPGKLTVSTHTSVAWYALFARQPEKALAASNRALALQPDNLQPAVNRAHALLFLGRIDEARAAYIAHKGEFVPEQDVWEAAIAKDFAEFGKRGLAHPQLAAMANALASAGKSAKAEQNARDVQEWMKLSARLSQHRLAGKNAEALAVAQQMLVISERLNGAEHAITANDIGMVAEILAALGRGTEAEEHLKRSIAILEKSGTPLDTHFLPPKLLSLGRLYDQQGRHADAEALYSRAIAIEEKGQSKDGERTGVLLDALGRNYMRRGLYPQAEAALKRSVEITEKRSGKDSIQTAIALNSLANLYREQGRYTDAEAVMLRSLALIGKGGSLLSGLLGTSPLANTLIGAMYSNLAEIYQAQGRYAEAESTLKKALDAAANDPDKSNLSLVLNNMAVLYFQQGRYAEAEPLLRRSGEITEQFANSAPDKAFRFINNLAVLYHDMGRDAEAEALHKRSLAMREKALGADHPDVALSLSNLATLYYEREQYADAEPLLKRALAIWQKVYGPDHPAAAGGLGSLAEIYRHEGRLAEAGALYRQALPISEKTLGTGHPDTASLLHNLAGYYMEKGQFAESARAYERSASIAVNTLGPDHAILARTFNNTAVLYARQQNWAQAAVYWQKSTDIMIRRARRGMQTTAQGGGKSEIDQDAGRFRRLVAVSHRLSSAAPDQALEVAGRMFETAQWAQGSAAAQSLAQMAVRKSKGNDALAKLIREQQDLSTEWQVKDKLLAAARSQPAEKREARVEEQLRQRLNAIDLRLKEMALALAKDFPDYAAFASPEPLTLAGAQSYLKDNEVLLLFLDTEAKAPFPEETFIWAVSKTSFRWVRAPIGTAPLKREVQALRCGLDYDGAWGQGSACPELTGTTYTQADYLAGKPLPFDPERAHTLYRTLFGQVEDMITGKRLLIAAPGPLSHLPFQVLVTAPTGKGQQDMRKIQWLIRRNSLTVLPAVSSLKALRRDAKASRGSKTYLGLGNPLLDGSGGADAERARQAAAKQACPKQGLLATLNIFSPAPRRATRVFMQGGYVDTVHLRNQAPLPETADELCTVADNLGAGGGSVLLGGGASETALKAMNTRGELSAYRTVHFATHGALAGQIGAGAEPGLILTPPRTASDADDGYLSASEIASLKLDADWVILSACNTAGGSMEDTEALSGLARSFFYAGARSVLVSHWSVNSDATVKLITGAMSGVTARPDAGRAGAMQQAMLALIDAGAPHEAHPAYWAPFVIAGEGAQ
jgi:CHAT domain-containing protein/tetratricopeptide (TPR) repeat protein